MNTQQMRIELRRYYGAAAPFSKKLDKMPDNQVQAIYFRLKNKGVLK